TLGAPLEIRARDASGRPLLGIPVEWLSSAGVVLPSSPVTDIQGRASARWVLGSSVGVQTASARLLSSPTNRPAGTLPSPASVLFEVQVDARPAASISALPSNMILPLGNAARVGVALFDDRGNRLTELPEFGFHVVDSTIAAGSRDPLQPEFVFSGLRPGSTQAVFTAGNLADTVDIEVQGATGGGGGDPPPLATLTLSPEVLDLVPGRSAGLVVSARSAAGVDLSTSEVVWASSAPAVADVDGFGRVAAFAAGTATITATLDGLVAAATVTVSEDEPVPEGPRPPGRVTDLTVVGQTSTEITVAFRAADDGSPGPVQHEIRYARAPLGFGWGQAETLESGTCASPLAMTPGQEIECRIDGLASGTSYDVQLVAWRISSSGESVYSPLSNVASATTDGGGGGGGGGGTDPSTPQSVLVSPSTVSLGVGESRSLSTVVLDQSGAAMGGVSLTWSSTNPAVATVDAAGTVWGVGPGTASIHATAGGVTGSSSISVAQSAPPPGGGGNGTYPNQPSGMTTILQVDGTDASMPGWHERWSGWDTHVTSVADASNPLGSGRSLQFDYAVGSRSAGNAQIITFPNGPVREMYIMYRIHYAPNWERIGHKNFYWGAQTSNRPNPGSSPTQFYVTHESNGSSKITQQNVGSVNAFWTGDIWSGKIGRWVDVEIHAIAESSPGAGDGQV
ncbi:MAG: Ig-like domain-containing protein, partial [Gemmatimonadetes bacterium]|nr:Ig-like domain-containing protein [Gemmatimonadota bacterium]